MEAPGSYVFGRFRGPSPYTEFGIDPSIFDYDEFLRFFFDRPLLPDDEFWDDAFLIDGAGTWAGFQDELRLLSHLTNCCEESGRLAERFGVGRLAQGFDVLWGAFLDCGKVLFEGEAPTDVRVRAIRSMAWVYRDVVVPSTYWPLPSIFFMWWDLLSSCVPGGRRRGREGLRAVGPDVDACLATLSMILAMPDECCQSCALHGLGHLPHPGAAAVVAKWLAAHGRSMTAKQIAWVEQCRDGIVM